MIPDIPQKCLYSMCLFFMIAPATLFAEQPLLKGAGVSLGLSYEAGYQAPPHGSNAGSSAKQRLSLNAAVDLNTLAELEGASVFFQFQNHNGRHGVSNIGDKQQFDGLDDPEYDRIHMLWFQQILLDGALRFKVGKVDPKSEFFSPKYGADHISVSTERSPTIIAQGPPSMSVNAFYHVNDSYAIAVGLYDASWLSGRDENTLKLHNPFNAQDFALFIENRFYWKNSFIPYPGQARVGLWNLDGDIATFDGSIEDGSRGYYLTLDQALNANGIGAYFQYGHGDKDSNALEEHIGFGLRWQGPITNRSSDVFGVGYSKASFSQAQGSPFRKEAETVYEIFYKSPISKYLLLQADIQAINDPGGINAEDVTVATFRATLSL